MKSVYQITPEILKLVAFISEKLGAINALTPASQFPNTLVQSATETQQLLSVYGMSFELEEVRDLLNEKPQNQDHSSFPEACNLIQLHRALPSLDYTSSKDFCKAHKILRKGLHKQAGKLRKGTTKVVKNDNQSFLAPAAEIIKPLLKELFHYLENSEDHYLIKSAYFYFKLKFILPFADGNEEIARFWQLLILRKNNPAFKQVFLTPILNNRREEYLHALDTAYESGTATRFMEFMLSIIIEALDNRIVHASPVLNRNERLETFLSNIKADQFSRKDYLISNGNISAATASRDLKDGVDKGLFSKVGNKRSTTYFINN